MARYTDSVCRMCRREGTKLFLKGEKCSLVQVRAAEPPHPSRPAWTGPAA